MMDFAFIMMDFAFIMMNFAVRGLLRRDELGQVRRQQMCFSIINPCTSLTATHDGQGYLTGDDAHSFHFAQQQRIYQQVYGADQGVDGVDGRPLTFMSQPEDYPAEYVFDAVWFVYTCRRLIEIVYTCRRLIDLSLIAGTRIPTRKRRETRGRSAGASTWRLERITSRRTRAAA